MKEHPHTIETGGLKQSVFAWQKKYKINILVAGIILLIALIRFVVLKPYVDQYNYRVEQELHDRTMDYAVGVFALLLLSFTFYAYRKKALNVMNFIGLTVTLLFLISILKGLTDGILLAANTQYGKTTYFKIFTIIRSEEDKVFMAQHGNEFLTKRELLELNVMRSGKSRDILSISNGDTIRIKYAKGFLDLEFRE